MARRIELHDVPEDLHRTLKARAAKEGLSLSEYLLIEIKKLAEQPTMAEMLERLSRLEPANPPESAAQIIREERDRR